MEILCWNHSSYQSNSFVQVGLGSTGEAITFEPHGHQRRQIGALDTRAFLVCGKDSYETCLGSPEETQWTDNIGGTDFLNAVNKVGEYQYLVQDQMFHHMNGPRMTNASYAGTTVDRNILVQRHVSTFSVSFSFLVLQC